MAKQKLSDRALTDLSRLGASRAQEAVESVIQLVERDEEKAVVLICALCNLVEGAAIFVQRNNKRSSREQCRERVIAEIVGVMSRANLKSGG